MSNTPIPPPDWLLSYYKERIDIDPEEGILRWKVKPTNQWGELGNLREDGRIGSRRNGRAMLQVVDPTTKKRHSRSATHIAWFLYYGTWPDRIVDHINRNPHDDRKANLRLVTAGQNSANCTKRKIASSRYKGVSWWKKKQCWKAYIGKPGGGTELYIGMFRTEDEAAAAYNCIAREWYGPYAVLNKLLPSTKEPEHI